MNSRDYISESQKVFDFLCRHYSVDWDAEINKKGFSGTWGSYGINKQLWEVWTALQGGDGFSAWTTAFPMLQSVAEEGTAPSGDAIRAKARTLMEIAPWFDMDRQVREDDRKDWVGRLRQFILLSDEEKEAEDLMIKVPRSLEKEVRIMLAKRKAVKLMRLKGSRALNLQQVKSVWVAGSFLMAENVMQMIDTRMTGTEDELKVYVMMNIDKLLDSSWFAVMFNWMENWWVLTDEPEYSNPEAKMGIVRRGVWKYRERDNDLVCFPYVYLDRIEEWRNERRDLIADGKTGREMYNVPIREWPVVCRAWLEMLIAEVRLTLADDKDGLFPVGRTIEQYISDNRRLLAGRTETDCNEVKDCFDCEGRAGLRRMQVENMIYPDTEERNLVKIDSSKVEKNLMLFQGSLMTTSKLDKMAAWAIMENEKKVREKLLQVDSVQVKKDLVRFAECVNARMDELWDDLFGAERTYVFVYQKERYQDGMTQEGGWHGEIVARLNDKKETWNVNAVTVGGRKGNVCGHCGKHSLLEHHYSGIRITHWATAAWLAGLTRKQLPFYLANYMAETYWGEVGNHLLNNINPLYLIKDEMSKRYSNAYIFNVGLCKRCRSAYAKQADEEAYIVIDADTCTKVGRMDKQRFSEWLKETCGTDNKIYI